RIGAMKKTSVAVLFMLAICAAQAQIYKWTDSQGNVHFSDTPHEGAQTITMPEPQGFSSPPAQPERMPPPLEAAPDKGHVYTKIAIIQPQNQETIRSSQGYIAVSVQVDPALMPGDALQLMFDGAALGDPQVNPLFQLNGIYRGSHTISVEILDANGHVLTSSNPITVFMQNPRVGMGTSGRKS
ncbi:MAG: DUF4124 domain-containing protein, partial [Legionellales bacterium]